MKLSLILSTIVAFAALTGCGDDSLSKGTNVDSGPQQTSDSGLLSASCTNSNDKLCTEYSFRMQSQLNVAPALCPSGAGIYAQPANCATSGFTGKCIVTAGNFVQIYRHYDAASSAADKTDCEDTKNGTWSADF